VIPFLWYLKCQAERDCQAADKKAAARKAKRLAALQPKLNKLRQHMTAEQFERVLRSLETR
jgi:hypothetical protein